MKRLIIICEGQTEQFFCKNNLLLPLQTKGIFIQTPLIKRSRGGIVKWSILKQEIETHLNSDITAMVTSFIDYYGILSRHEFPKWDDCEKIADRNARMDALEKSMHESIQGNIRHRFIPYLQLHEFEGLLFNDINIFYDQIPPNDIKDRKELRQTFADYNNPEMINDNKETSPSHRLKLIIKGYSKLTHGDILAQAIGLNRIRNKSPRFNNWITKLENI